MTPPLLARWLLRIVLPQSDRRFVLDDLSEEFERITRESGPRSAAAWYWRQTLASIGPLAPARLRDAGTLARQVAGPPSAIVVDAKQAGRWVARNPRVAATVVATLGLAFGAVLAGFAVMRAVVLRPLPFPDADRIVHVRIVSPFGGSVRGTSLHDVNDWRERSRSFEAVSAYTADAFRLTGLGQPRQIAAQRVGVGFDRVLGVHALAGRLFEPADFARGGSRVAVLTHGFWQHEFGGNPAAVGSTITLNEVPYRVVGILPRLTVTFPERHDLWVPLVPRPDAFWEASRTTGWVAAIGRINRDIDEAAAELTAVAAQLANEYPESNREKTVARLAPIGDDLVGPLLPALTLLSIALAFVLLIAAGNIATLLLATIARRRSEFAVRAALGAGRGRIARQLGVESIALCALAAIAGTALAPLLVRVFLAAYPAPLPRPVETIITPSLAAGAALLAILTAALVAAPQIVRVFKLSSVPQWSERMTLSRADRGAAYLLVAAQVALSLMLVIAGTALVRTMLRLSAVDIGFQSAGVLTLSVTPSPSRFSTAAAAMGFYESVLESVGQLPGVRSAAAGVGVPLTSSGWRFGIQPPGATANVLVAVNLVSPGYFETLGIGVRQGRLLTAAEQRTGTAVAMVNTAFAQLLAADGRPLLGRTIEYSDRAWEVVGIVDAARHQGPRAAPVPELFIPWHMAGKRPQAIAIRTDGDPRALVPALAERIRALDPTAPLVDVQLLDARLQHAVAADRFRMTLLAALAAMGVLLAALGAYSTTAYAVARRTREYGIRIALGEHRPSIWRRALWTAIAPTIAGVAVGAVGSVVCARFLEAFLFNVSARDPRAIGLAAFALVGIATVAAATSARRAGRVDPIVALRAD